MGFTNINKSSVIGRLKTTINCYGEVNEENEMLFSADVESIKSLIEIYDQVWYIRHMPKNGKHSIEVIELVKKIYNLFRRYTRWSCRILSF